MARNASRKTRDLEQVRQLRRQAQLRRQRRTRLWLLTAGALIVVIAAIKLSAGHSDVYPAPSRAALAGLRMRQRILAVANSQVGYSTQPTNSYCNKFSAYWDSGSSNCPHAELSEEWCADFAAWAWHKAGVDFTYGYNSDEINAGAASFYQWAVAAGTWHPAGGNYRPRPGDVAVYGLSLYPEPSAAHVAVVSSAPAGQHGPNVINGDGDRTGFSVVETGTNQIRSDTPHHSNSTIAGYASPT